MGLFTPEEIDNLYAPFLLDEHTIREGYQNTSKTKIRWFVYVEKGEVQRRLEKLFPGEWESTEPKVTYGASSISASLSIGIRGIWRSNNGAADGTGADDAKGAATDAFRRTASMWGIAGYVYDMDFQIWTDTYPKGDWDKQKVLQKEAWGKFVDWYNRKFGAQNAQGGANSGATQQKVSTPAGAQKMANSGGFEPVLITLTADDIAMIKTAHSDLSPDQLRAALGNISNWSEWTAGKDAALKAIADYKLALPAEQVAF